MPCNSRYRRQPGFTLIEVMVAMMIVAMALPALLDQAQSLANHTFVARGKTQAFWLAQNKMTEISLRQRLNGRLPDRQESDTVEMGRQRWTWTITTQQTPVENMLRVEVAVTREGQDDTMARLAGFFRSG